MKTGITFIFMLYASFAMAQFAIIQDKDNSCNVRYKAGKKEAIIDRLENGHFVYAFPNDTQWTDIDYTKDNKERNGTVYKDRLIYVTSYLKIPIIKNESNSIKLKKDGLEIVIAKQAFDKTKHKFSYYKQANDQIQLVDKTKYWGTDGGCPKSEYKSIEVILGQMNITLPKKAFQNLYEINLEQTKVNYDKKNDIIYIQASNGDGAGGYVVIWKIEKGTYKERYVAYGF